MLAALIATRIPPAPPVFFYTNQFLAAVNTFTCITITRRAAALTTSLVIGYSLVLSTPGQPALLDLLNLYYYRIISFRGGDDPNFLSNTIGQVISVVDTLTSTIQILPVAVQDQPELLRLQRQLAIALADLNSLGTRVS